MKTKIKTQRIKELDNITDEMKKELYKIYKKRMAMWNMEDPPFFMLFYSRNN